MRPDPEYKPELDADLLKEALNHVIEIRKSENIMSVSIDDFLNDVKNLYSVLTLGGSKGFS